MLVTVSEQGTNKPLGLTESFIKSQNSMACILSFVERIQLKILHDIENCVRLIFTKFRSDTMSHFSVLPSKNMQFCNEQITTQPLFSPPCASATYASARMCRRKNCDAYTQQCALFSAHAQYKGVNSLGFTCHAL